MCRRVTRQFTLITVAWTIWRPEPQEGREDDCPQHGAQPPLLRGLGEHTSPKGKGWGGARGPVPSRSVGADSPAVKVCLSVPLHLLSPAETFPSKPKSHNGFSPPGKHRPCLMTYRSQTNAIPSPYFPCWIYSDFIGFRENFWPEIKKMALTLPGFGLVIASFNKHCLLWKTFKYKIEHKKMYMRNIYKRK